MRRLLAWLVCLVAPVGFLTAQTPPIVNVTAVSPEPANRLASGQNLSVRVAYESDQPLRFQAAGYYQGKKHDRLAMNPSPVYPAGKGEAIVWVFGQPGARIDEVRIVVHEAKWKSLFEVPVKAVADWHAGVPPTPEAPWVKELNDAQQRMLIMTALQDEARESHRESVLMFILGSILTPLAFLCVPGYPLLQAYTLWKMRGPARLLSALPLSFMLPVYAFCLYALSKESNLWPLYAIFASPVAFIITLVVFLVARRKAKAATA